MLPFGSPLAVWTGPEQGLTQRRGYGVLRSSPFRCSPKFVLSKSSGLLERANLEREGVPKTRCQRREGAGDKEVHQPVARVCLRGRPPGPYRAEPTVDRQVDRDCQREKQR